MRAPILSSFLVVMLLCPGYDGREPRALSDRDDTMRVERVVLYPDDPKRTKVGDLTFLGGIALQSAMPAFGGYSSMVVRGDRFTLLSDGGNILRFRMDGAFRISDARARDLSGGPGSGWMKASRDSESMTTDGAGHYWVGFEGTNQIWRYDGAVNGPGHGVAPAVMRDWPDNLGAESLVRLHDGWFLTIAEDGHPDKRPDLRIGVVFAGDPVAHPNRYFRFAYRPPAGFDPSDATQLPDGRIVVLNRGFDLPFRWSAILTLIDRAAIRPGAVVAGREIARFAAPMTVDNYEALAATRENGATILWMASDDNQMILERSLLLKFRLDG